MNGTESKSESLIIILVFDWINYDVQESMLNLECRCGFVYILKS